MNKSHLLGFVCTYVFTLCAPMAVNAALIFDNGSVDPYRTTWSAKYSVPYTIYDDFVLAEDTAVDSIEYNIFQNSSSQYFRTYITIMDGLPGIGSVVAPESIYTVSNITANGLTTSNPNVTNGFTHLLEDLSINLSAGTYFLGISIESTDGSVTSIGSGPGSGQTIGPGLTQYFDETNTLRSGDHMAFKVFGETAVVPIPAAAWLFVGGLLGLFGVARRKAA